MKNFTPILCLFFISILQMQAQINLWEAVNESELTNRNDQERWNNPSDYDLYRLDVELLRAELSNVPHEEQTAPRNSYAQFVFPMPGGRLGNFRLVEYSMIEPELARKFSHIKTYIGIDDETGVTIRLNFTKNQLFGTMREAGQTYYIDPYYKGNNNYYITYNIKNDHREDRVFECGVHEMENGNIVDINSDALDTYNTDQSVKGSRGESFGLLTYRLAVSATFEFTEYYGGTVEDALDGIVTIVNRVNSIYEREAAIRLILVGNNDLIIFTDANEDPFEDGNLDQMINQNQVTVNQWIGSANYDIGHVLGRAFLQGLAQLGAVCGNSKARGGSVLNPPIGDAFSVDIVCHEMGHQFNAPHTMYHCHNVNVSTSYEPGSGTTIMAYTGICSPQTNIQAFSDDYYHANSLERIIGFTRSGNGADCPEIVDFGNTYPDIELDYPNKLYIPVNTPFRLTANAADAETPSTLTYCWEQYQPGFRDYQMSAWDIRQPQANEPIFRSYPPSSSPTRYFPSLPRIVNNVDYVFEQLPTYARDLKFRLTVRDNASENGGTVWKDQNIEVIDNSVAGKFEITNFKTADTLHAGEYVEVKWNVADTDLPPFRTAFVDIYLSDDGGQSFPYLVKSNTKNDGSAFVNIPEIQTDRFRFMIQASNSVYLDVSDRSGMIVSPDSGTVGFSYNDQCYQICAPDVVEYDILTFGLGGFDGEINFEFAGNLPPGGIASFSNPTILAGEQTSMKIDVREAAGIGEYDLTFRVTGDGIDTMYRTIESIIVTNNFDDLTLQEPVNGATGVEFVPELSWTPSDDAMDYTVQVADDATFNNIVFERQNIDTTDLALDLQLDAGKVYFWRVMPRNACGLQDVNRISAFQIKDLSCEEFCSTEPSITLSSSGTPTAEMMINTGINITVNDLNVTHIYGRHQDLGQIVFTLEGPNGTQVEMYSAGTCEFFNTDIDMGFDDDAAAMWPNCVDDADEGKRFVPRNPLSALNGVSGTEYKLIMDDVMSGAGGALDGWCFEICGDVSAINPILEHADTVHMFNLETRVISSDKLEITHTQYTADQITITIVDQPAFGRLLLNGSPIESGSTLTMQDIYDGNLQYENQSTLYDRDHFSVIATDPGNGFLGTPRVDFIIGLSATNESLPNGHEIVIFPNPAKDQLNVRLMSDRYLIEDIAIYNMQGKQMNRFDRVNSSVIPVQLDNYAPGIYILQIRSGEFLEVRKFIKQ